MSENSIVKYGKFEVDTSLMSDYVRQQKINEAERDRISLARDMYLQWILDHVSNKVLKPPY